MIKLLEKNMSDYFKKFINDCNTLAIIITGSYGRTENDYLSDIDWVLVVDKKKNNISGFKERFNNIDFDCRIEEYKSLKDNEWYMDQYYAYLNCKIYYDKNNKFKKIQENHKKNGTNM